MNVSSQHRINCRTPEGTVVTRTVRRRPFPMTAAYALQTTDHKGQTYTDIATPPKYRLVVCSRRTDSVCRWLVFQSICCALAKLRMVNNQAGTSRQHIAPNVVAPVGRRNVVHRILPRRQPQRAQYVFATRLFASLRLPPPTNRNPNHPITKMPKKICKTAAISSGEGTVGGST